MPNCVVWAVAEPAPAPTGSLPPVTMRFTDTGFAPHVLVARIGQEVVFRHDAPSLVHSCVRLTPRRNTQGLSPNPLTGGPRTWVPDRSEKDIRVETGCVAMLVHAHVWVLDHPHFDVTAEGGRFAIGDLPPGRHDLRVWHEHFADRGVEVLVEVRPGKTTEVDVQVGVESSSPR